MAHRRNGKRGAKARTNREEAGDRGRRRFLWLGGGTLAAIAVAALFVASLAAPPSTTGPSEGPRPGQAAPGFTITDVDGNPFVLQDHRGKVVVLDFMGSRCVSCVVEMPHLVATHERLRNANFAMISIDVGGPLGTEDPDEARTFLATHGGSWRIALDNQGLEALYEVGGRLPTLVVIDKEGIVRDHHAGLKTSDQLIALVEALL